MDDSSGRFFTLISCQEHSRFTYHDLGFAAELQNQVNPALQKKNRTEPSAPKPMRYIPGFFPLALVFALLFTAFEISAKTSEANKQDEQQPLTHRPH